MTLKSCLRSSLPLLVAGLPTVPAWPEAAPSDAQVIVVPWSGEALSIIAKSNRQVQAQHDYPAAGRGRVE